MRARFNNLAGRRFGTLLVGERSGTTSGGAVVWGIACDCGASFTARGNYLLTDRTRCPGCSTGYLPLPRSQDRLAANSEFVTECGCQIWTGSVDQKGYGSIRINGASVGAHRVSWIRERGPIPAGLFVLHRCDTPPCINIDHLFLGTQADNIADMVRKGRQRSGNRYSNRHIRSER